jgi:hypothetical protein
MITNKWDGSRCDDNCDTCDEEQAKKCGDLKPFKLQVKVDGFAWKSVGEFETLLLAIADAEQIDLDTPVRVMNDGKCVWKDID